MYSTMARYGVGHWGHDLYSTMSRYGVGYWGRALGLGKASDPGRNSTLPCAVQLDLQNLKDSGHLKHVNLLHEQG